MAVVVLAAGEHKARFTDGRRRGTLRRGRCVDEVTQETDFSEIDSSSTLVWRALDAESYPQDPAVLLASRGAFAAELRRFVDGVVLIVLPAL